MIWMSWWCALATANAQLPCDWFDHNGDGVLGANTWLYVLGNYGVEGGPMDVDSSGVQDLDDLLAFVPYFGALCPVDWFEPTSGHIVDLALVEHAVHTEALVGLNAVLPAGSVTYRLYALMSQPEDHVLAIYGDAQRELSLQTEGDFFGFGEDFDDTMVVSDVQPVFYAVFPAHEFSTWFSVGALPGDSDAGMGVVPGLPNWAANLDVGSIVMNDSIGSAFIGYGWSNPDPSNGAVLVGQFTVTDPSSFTGTLNLIAATVHPDGSPGFEQAEGLTFSNEYLTVFGCMDASALNFDALATYQLIGACSFAGDYTGDGMFSVEDLLGMLADFGCTDCPEGDLNGDGVVSVQDILIFLTWL